MKVAITLNRALPYRIFVNQYDKLPRFVTFAGLQFQPLNRNYLAAFKTRDLDLKKTLYQAHGVSEYWIVLTDEDAVDRFLLVEGSYRHDGQYRESIAFGGMDGVSVDLTSVW